MNAVCVTCGAANESVESCWRCGAILPEPPFRLGRPAPYTGAALHFADGSIVPFVDGRIVELGRAVVDPRIVAALAECPTVSRRHAAVLLSGRMLTITDHDSCNGTFVDATEARPTLTCPLQPLIIGLGHSVEVRIVPTREPDEVIGE